MQPNRIFPPHKVLVCPWWFCPSFDNPLRRHFHNPALILGPYIRPGMTVLDIGCGMGYFSIPLAQLVGQTGRVICLDLQPKMLAGVMRRARQAGVTDQIQLHPVKPDRLDLKVSADFALAFWMLHEVQNQQPFLAEVWRMLLPAANFLLVEPRVHVTAAAFMRSVELAQSVGFQVIGNPEIAFSRSALLRRA